MPQLFPSAPAGFGRAAWQPATWTFTREEELSIPTICQFGRDYAGARDGCVYHYFIHPRNESSGTVQKPGTVYLARSPRDRMPDRASYGFFAGMRGAEPEWTRDVTRKKPVFEDRDNGVGWVMSVTFNPGLRRYPLLTDHIPADRGNPGVFDAAEPLGAMDHRSLSQRSRRDELRRRPERARQHILPEHACQMAKRGRPGLHAGLYRGRTGTELRQPESDPREDCDADRFVSK